MLAKGFLKQRHQLDDPPVHGRVIDLNTVFRNHLFEITKTQRIGHVPARTSQERVNQTDGGDFQVSPSSRKPLSVLQRRQRGQLLEHAAQIGITTETQLCADSADW